MLQRILHSPFFPIALFVLIIAFLFLSVSDADHTQQILARYSFWGFTFVALLWTSLIQLNNRKNPKNKIHSWRVIPPEFREMDEGQQWVTFRACRNVYMYYAYALPAAALFCFLFLNWPAAPLLAIGVLGLGQYLVYWLTIRTLNNV